MEQDPPVLFFLSSFMKNVLKNLLLLESCVPSVQNVNGLEEFSDKNNKQYERKAKKFSLPKQEKLLHHSCPKVVM